MGNTKIELKQGKNGFTFPITPESFEASMDVENVSVNVNNLGEVNLKGSRNLQSISWSSFFPRHHYEFCKVSEAEMKSAKEYVAQLLKYEKENATLTLNISGFISITCTIESFSYGQEDGTGDISYTISFKEYRAVSGTTAKKQTAKRPTKAVIAHLYKWKKGDTWKKVAKKQTGNTENWSKLRKANKKRIDKAAMAYHKKYPKKKKTKESTILVGVKVLIK